MILHCLKEEQQACVSDLETILSFLNLTIGQNKLKDHENGTPCHLNEAEILQISLILFIPV